MIRAIRHRVADERLPPRVSPVYRAYVPDRIDWLACARQPGKISRPGRLQFRRQPVLVSKHPCRPVMGLWRAGQDDKDLFFHVVTAAGLLEQAPEPAIDVRSVLADQGRQIRADRPGYVE